MPRLPAFPVHVCTKVNFDCFFNLKELNHFGSIAVDGRIILKWILKTYSMRKWTDVAQDRGPVVGSFERGNEL
jgi:hypothetical protein